MVGHKEHEIRIRDGREGEPGVGYPPYRRRAQRPPGDCGDVPGFYDLLAACADPGDDNYADAVAWLDEYDPDALDELPIKYALGRIASRRDAARARPARRAKP